MNKINNLTQTLSPHVSALPHSRIHRLKTFNTNLATCFVKREDELGFGISGSKLRKYTSLLPHLLAKQCQEAVIIGSAYSNHILGLTQLLIENNIKPTLFLLGEQISKRQGNLLLTSLLVAESQIHWMSRKDWVDVESLATKYAQEQIHTTIVVPEGAFMPAALPGALTLALDILQNEQQLQEKFDHIFIDAGTGLTAIATILVFAWLKKKTQIHILLLADNEAIFIDKLKQMQLIFEQLVNAKLHWQNIIKQFTLFLPTHAKSFGAINKNILHNIKTIAHEEGFFTDPIYSAKLFFETKKILKNKALQGNVLIIHSGGCLTLMGFQEQLSKFI